MSFSSIFYNSSHLRTALLVLGAVLAVAAYLIYRMRQGRKEQAVDIEQQAQALYEATIAEEKETGSEDGEKAAGGQTPSSVERSEYLLPEAPRTSLALGAARAALVLLALVVAAGFTLVLLPDRTVNSMAQALRLSNPVPPDQEMISFLYLGDQAGQREFHIQGVVRNITTQPIENLDAVIRLYATDGSLLETVVVRMDTDRIAPDATAAFHLSYPDYKGQFGSYSVDFKLRQGALVPYKDMRASHNRD